MSDSSDQGIRGLHVAITGAARGIGKAMALQLARAGAHVAVSDLNLEGAQQTAEEARALGVQALAVKTDVTQAADCTAMVNATVAAFGRLDVLFCNAGIAQVKPLLELTAEDIDTMFAVNVKGQILTLQAGARVMQGQTPIAAGRPKGKIIMTASIAGRYGGGIMAPVIPHYRASKAAVISVTQSAAWTLAPHITVNAICPGIVETAMWESIDREWTQLEGQESGTAWRQRVGGIPMGRAQQADDVAALATYLVSAGSDYMTGQSINIDGGLSMN